MEYNSDICIIGAGPGGAAAAIKLGQLGVNCLLVDKSSFPRDKICGDGISGKTVTLLNRLNPEIVDRMHTDHEHLDCWGVKFVAPNLKELDFSFRDNFNPLEDVPPGFISKRIDFDNLLIEEVKKDPKIKLLEGVNLMSFQKENDLFILSDRNGEYTITTKLVIAANGAQSAFSRQIGGLEKEPRHHAAGVRAYYKNVEGVTQNNYIELHYLKSFSPGYFWIFPLPDGHANVGAGMSSKKISQKKVNLKKALTEIVEHHPVISKRFQKAERIGSIKGFGLPLGSKKRKISGDRYMLIGDAGHLIDPLTGEGIANAIYSGTIAAEIAAKAIAANDYSAEFLKAYDEKVFRVMGPELQISYQLQKMLSYPWLFNIMANLTIKNDKLGEVISCMFKDIDVRKKITNPIFLFKMLLNIR
ncbi:MAG: geranylgeranyl reductase family protein [Bacteroidota bacterium]